LTFNGKIANLKFPVRGVKERKKETNKQKERKKERKFIRRASGLAKLNGKCTTSKITK
jgi:hypothetical protein